MLNEVQLLELLEEDMDLGGIRDGRILRSESVIYVGVRQALDKEGLIVALVFQSSRMNV